MRLEERCFCDHCSKQVHTTSLYGERLETRGPIVRSYHFFPFTDEIRSLIHQLKYKGDRKCIERFLSEVETRIDWSFFAEADFLVPLPLHPYRQIKRGYNQAELVSRALSEITGVRTRTCMIRSRYTRTQTRKTKGERYRTMRNVFAPHPRLFCPEARLILIDDVLTTGATLESCAEAAASQGAQDIRACTVARVE
ncbi:ComF family protein [Chitinivibrio alkaliphilus]|uniref:Amidophosphoribosyl-transferase n=1 Tax=Chitinivibrio alkaliphilus ACht1 TaxID=1313304 RepID=U7D585_9BACT|nr:ComF family protein [Chitinivibrio alkaliphilus]ERP31684.1 amidophosphoribosyl-transferase [Chitinivibrio alkaliphilus ACht1]